ncbi:MAG: aminoglycoside 6-adenylyltransferase [Chloroflexota bacterium]|nr:aminoglycoside 6-adenylyltransferase [Chloroflexota bacterium]
MRLATDEAEVLAKIERWASGHDLIRLVLLTSSRAVPNGPVDLLSDYDIVLVVSEPEAFAETAEWVHGFGAPLIIVRDRESPDGIEKQSCMVLYDDGTKVDYSVWPLTVLAAIRTTGRLPEEFDVGYRVLLDKDGLAGELPPATYQAHIPAPPTAAEYRGVVEELWWVATYVAKYLWRDEFLPARVILDYELKYLLLRRLLEWQIELDHQWSIRPGFFGRGLQRSLDPETWAEFEATYTGADREQSWAALFRTIALFRRLAIGVGRDLGHEYPRELETKMMSYLRQIRDLGE